MLANQPIHHSHGYVIGKHGEDRTLNPNVTQTVMKLSRKSGKEGPRTKYNSIRGAHLMRA